MNAQLKGNHMSEDIREDNFDQATIGFCPNEERLPWFTGLSELPRDQSLTPLCRILIICLWTNSDAWEIRMSQLIKDFKPHAGKNKMYAAMNEAIAAGYIRREIIQESNLKRTVKYYVSRTGKFKKSFRLPGFRDPENEDPENRDIQERSKEKKDQKDKEEERGASPSSNPLRSSLPSKKKIQEPKQEVAPRIMLDSVQQESLLNKLGGSLELRQKCYEKLSDWKIGKNKTDCKSDYLAICNWVIDAVKDSTLTSTSGNSNTFESDKELADKVLMKFGNRKDIREGYNYIEFDNGMIPTHLKFGSKEFRFNVLNELRKRKLDTEGL